MGRRRIHTHIAHLLVLTCSDIYIPRFVENTIKTLLLHSHKELCMYVKLYFHIAKSLQTLTFGYFTFHIPTANL